MNSMHCCLREGFLVLNPKKNLRRQIHLREGNLDERKRPIGSIRDKAENVEKSNHGSDLMDVGWRKGLSPKELTLEWIQAIQELFLEGTGEQYFAGSIQSLPVPNWEGNLMLFDSNEKTPTSMRGLLWTTPFKEDTVRIVSFVLDQGSRNRGWGSQAWNKLVLSLHGTQYTTIQLEVRAANSKAINFYRKRGLEVIQELHGYYKSGLGYLMRGPLQTFNAE